MDEATGNHALVTAEPATRSTISSTTVDARDLSEDARRRFGNAVGACLTLVAGTGMSGEDRKTWFRAAYIALNGLTYAQVEAGCREAMRTVDHPSKIVPAIVKVADRLRAERAAQVEPVAFIPKHVEAVPFEETQAILKAAGVNLTETAREVNGGRLDLNPERACRTPTRADYLRVGVAPDVLDGMVEG